MKFHIHVVLLKVIPLVSLQNKSAFLCGVMKTYRQREKQGSKVQESTKGPDEAKIKVNNVPCVEMLCGSSK